MQLKNLSKRRLFIVAPSGFILFAALIFNFIPKNFSQENPDLIVKNSDVLLNQEQTTQDITIVENDTINQNQEYFGLPMNLKIPAINVDAAVIQVGLTSDGAMDIPKNPDEVAWYSLGARPGMIGSAVMAGHYDWINNKKGVFDKLNKLIKGDKIYVEDEEGTTSTFVVREIKIYDKDDDALNVFISNDDKAHLNLITCTGTWNKAEKIYSDRLIVFADKE